MEIAAPSPSATEAKNFSKLAGSIRRAITPRKTPSGPLSLWAMTVVQLAGEIAANRFGQSNLSIRGLI